ncbi:TrlF family AAA-like ATPase [Nocardioides sp. NPDC087217]|uniref:TrlF family AAA-like ATPase n=1 Tax=Nocardioides sp. NPDC087217 TaxID=3364335 RepID=UPI00381E8C23
MPRLLAQGSVWRRWEPHVHLPGTLLNDNFGRTTTAEALDALAACNPAIEVVGVTDYFSTASFRRATDAYAAGAGANLTYLFPNVEMRLNDATARGNGVNIHVLAAADDVDVLDDLLGRLNFSFQDRDYNASDSGLISLGRAYLGSDVVETAARKEGANQFKVAFDQLRGLFQRDFRLRERCLVFVAAGQDGTSGLRSDDGGFAAYRQGLERFAHGIFSGNPNDREFWAGRKPRSVEEIEADYGCLKACLHGSDAHQPDKLGVPDLDRFTWLKGDPAFETLRQACLSPERRTWVGSTTPGVGQHGRIDSVSVNDQDWFIDGTVPVNTGLVAIIGPRGSGKTALADIIAVGAGSHDPFENDAAFVCRAGRLLDGSMSTTGWHDEESTSHSLGQLPDPAEPQRRIRYLSQQFVERLCSSDGVRPELLHEIERVIFETWPVEQRQGATSFRELLDIRLASARAAQTDELSEITRLSAAITEQRVVQTDLAGKQRRRATLSTSISSLESQVRELTGRADAASSERHGLISSALATRQRELQATDRRLTDLRGLLAAVTTTRTVNFPALVQRLQNTHQHAGLTSDQWSSFEPIFSVDVDTILGEAIATTTTQLSSVAGTPPDSSRATQIQDVQPPDFAQLTVAELTAEQTRLQNLVGLDRQRTRQLTALQAQLTSSRGALVRLDEEIAHAQGAASRIDQLTEQRSSHYAAYFDHLLNEEQELRLLYAPLEQILQGFGETVAKLKLSVKRKVDLDAWVTRGEALIDLRTAGPFRGSGGLKPIAEQELLTFWETSDGDAAARAIQEFSAKYSASLREHAPAARSKEAAYREWERGIAHWLYSVNHISVVYSLEYDGLNVERLSPGSRGIVLLLLYLAIDQGETDPLIIDQPEENLDPKSVYSELVELFQSASERRQIIMVTHNANLVVNTDVDQVIVASCEGLEEGKLPRLSYEAGGLENPQIRQAVCEVLEGGADAFRQRARRLHIDAPATPRLDP